MLTGFYTAASGMFMQQRSLNVIANNMANGETPGFKSERVVSTTFEQELLTRQERGNNGFIGKGSPVRLVQDVPSLFDPSLLRETERPLDMAINGEGYFNIKSPDGQQYMTRNGNFDIDKEGYLVLHGAGRVMGQRGEINLKGSSSFKVDTDGNVMDIRGRKIDKLLITKPTQGTQLAKFSNGMYQIDKTPQLVPPPVAAPAADAGAPTTAPSAPTTAPATVAEPAVETVKTPNIQQGVLERSNIDLQNEMSMMMETQRTFQACSKALQAIDQINQKTVAIGGQ
ncbi:MAG: flagellar hook-basal body protein [Hydrogenoanaerobacterium sp.]